MKSWTDSPVGLLAWMMQKFHEFTPMADHPEDVLDRDQVLTNFVAMEVPDAHVADIRAFFAKVT